MSSGVVSPYLLLVLTTLFWGGNFVVGRALHGLVPPIALTFWRWAIALAVLAPFAARAVYRERSEIRQHWGMLTVMGALSACAFSVFLFVGLTRTTATNALLLNSTSPVLIVLVGWLWAGERITMAQAAGIGVSLTGIATIVFKGTWEGMSSIEFGAGDLWILGAVGTWAVYSVLLRRRPPTLGPLVFLAATIAAGTAVTLPLYAIEAAAGAHIHVTTASVAGLLYVALFPSLLSHAFWNRAVSEVGSSRAGLFIHLTPVFGTLLAVLFLGESLYLYHAAGITLILTGIVMTTRGARNGTVARGL